MSDKPVAQMLTHQQEQYVRLRCRGLTPEAAAHAARLPSDTASIYQMHEENPLLDEYLLQMREEIRKQTVRAGVRVQFTKDDAALLYLEAHAKAKDATEEIKAVDSLVKLYGLAEPEKREVTVNSKADLQELEDKDLMALAGETIMLDPSEYVSRTDD
jgi:hypothetical protein